MNQKNCLTCKNSRHDNWDDYHCMLMGKDGVSLLHIWRFGCLTRSQRDLVHNLGCGCYEKQE